MTDPLAEIAAERESARAALASAEQVMKAEARDPKAFARAKREREAALANLERLDWAERAEQDRAAAAEQQLKLDQLRDAQQQALAAHDRAREVATEVGPLVAAVAQKVRELRECQQAVDRGVHFETFALNDGTLQRQTVVPSLDLSGEVAVLALRAARELVRLSPISLDIATTRASQGSL